MSEGTLVGVIAGLVVIGIVLYDWLNYGRGSFEQGYDYALQILKKHGEAAEDGLWEEAHNAFEHGDFERGMIQALRDYQITHKHLGY